MTDDRQRTHAGSDENREFKPVPREAAEGLLRYLVDEEVIPESAVETLRQESISILRSCSAPQGLKARRTGLVCGYVQSGKTVSIETVSALAKDNGFRIALLIAGVNTNLVDQSIARMNHLRAGAGGYEWVMLSNPRDNARGQLESLVQEWRHHGRDCRMLFITVMKNVHHLRALTILLRGVQLSGVPALLFDDEADQASPNTQPKNPKPSPVYAAIDELRAALPHHTYLQYTATPQAPLLISRIDSLSADFAELVSPGLGYVGGSVFFRDRPELNFPIPDEEIFDHTNLPSEPPQSLIDALHVFFVGVAATYADVRSPTANRSMLIHPHQRVEVHHAYLRWVEALKANWVTTLSAIADPDRPELLQQFERAHAELSRTVSHLPPFDSIAPKLPVAIGRAILTLVNSDNGREISWANGYAHILVGGEKLSRGYTVKGLTVTYMPRGPGGWTADTIQQRARFFGYHARPTNNYLDYCRVYLHGGVARVYKAYIDHEEDMRAQIRRNQGKPLQMLKRAFFLDKLLRPTRHYVMRQLYRRPRLKESSWFEQRAPHAAPNGGAENAKLVADMSARLTLREDEFRRHYYADVRLTDLLEHFLIPFSCPDARDEIPMCAIRLILADEAERADNSVCRLIFMDPRREPRERKMTDGKIELMQGKSSSEDPDRYPGDRNIRQNDKERVTVQIHNLDVVTKDKDAGGREIKTGTVAHNVPALAIYLPPRLAKDVIVQPDN